MYRNTYFKCPFVKITSFINYLLGMSQDPTGCRGKRGKHNDLGSERSGEHLRYITQPWFQERVGEWAARGAGHPCSL